MRPWELWESVLFCPLGGEGRGEDVKRIGCCRGWWGRKISATGGWEVMKMTTIITTNFSRSYEDRQPHPYPPLSPCACRTCSCLLCWLHPSSSSSSRRKEMRIRDYHVTCACRLLSAATSPTADVLLLFTAGKDALASCNPDRHLRKALAGWRYVILDQTVGTSCHFPLKSMTFSAPHPSITRWLSHLSVILSHRGTSTGRSLKAQ